MLRIGYDAKRLFCNNTGLGNYSRSLVGDLYKYYPKNEYVLFTPKLRRNEDTELFFNADFEQVLPSSPFRGLWRSFGIPQAVVKNDIDVYHGLSGEIPFGIQNTDAVVVVSIHDLIQRLYPNDFIFSDRMMYDFKCKYACRHSDHIVAISQSTKRDIMAQYGVPESKITVIYQSCASAFRRDVSKQEQQTVLEKYGLPASFLLSVGSIIERKNLLTTVKAVAQLRSLLQVPLVVVGNGGKYKQTVQNYIKEHNLEKNVVFLENVASSDLPALYRAAKMLLYPSRYEGFGIPIIESLYSRTPVITTKFSSLPEAAGPGAVYVDPDRADEIANAIVKLLTAPDYYSQLITDGYNYVQRFNNRDIARYWEEFYHKIV